MILWTANLVWVSLAVMIAVIILGGAKFGSGLLVGIPNRALMVAYGCWLMVVAWRAERIGQGAGGR